MLGGLNISNHHDYESASNDSYNPSLSAKANSSPIENEGISALMGICVFKGDTLYYCVY